MGYGASAVRAFGEIVLGGRKRALEMVHNCAKGETFVLTYLHITGRAAPPSELGRALDSSAARISAILKALEQKGEITRAAGRQGRLRVLVALTETGRTRAVAATREINRLLVRVFYDMGERDTREFIKLSRRFLELVDKHAAWKREKEMA